MIMELTNYATVLPIVIICYLVGMICKTIKKIPDKVIPWVVALVGGVIAIPAMYVMSDFPATDVISSISVGIASGLMATGTNQVYKQIKKDE